MRVLGTLEGPQVTLVFVARVDKPNIFPGNQRITVPGINVFTHHPVGIYTRYTQADDFLFQADFHTVEGSFVRPRLLVVQVLKSFVLSQVIKHALHCSLGTADRAINALFCQQNAAQQMQVLTVAL